MQARGEPIRFRSEVMETGESFDQTGFELPLPPQLGPADAGQGELFGDEFSPSETNDGEPVFWRAGSAGARRPRQTTTLFKPTRRNQFEHSRLDR